MTIFGWDASDFDWGRGPMDLASARQDGITFFTHKATEGVSTRHVKFGQAVARARAAGIPFIGAYGVPRSSGTVAAQVDYFLSYVDSQAPWWHGFDGWFWQCDLEHWPYDQVPPSRGVEWCRLVRERTGRRVLLYAPRWAYGDSIGGSDPLWQSSYGSNPATHYRAAYPGDGSSRWAAYSGRTPVILQYGSRTTIGSQATCDANAFRGSAGDFARLVGATTQTGDSDMELDNPVIIQKGWDNPPAEWGIGLTPANETQSVGTILGRLWWQAYLLVKGLTYVSGQVKANGEMLRQLLAAAQADEVRDAAMAAAIQALAQGGGVDSAPIVAAVAAVRDEARQRFGELGEQLHAMQRRAEAAEAERDALDRRLAAAYAEPPAG